ncbi:MAG: LLM class flavin-dependent oxidoreductase [Burkholderiales bacterium]|nr:LLM class flavin-dependent oxidoreductase [Burkholderiales bacterium]MDE1927246.1 LLM class flavin-dependent oxidoreductase [Burkholderiales bacterium]MDE2158224.1 LLM class flavin-dependent oxidoreductase [Burkholderiales bacterium]MDE2504006.1 LLM class flavin-dependent oxidoreductase [Burkholderiales bacterium]
MQLSVLDQSVSCAGRDEGHALCDTLALAQDCEALGYARFWVSEHHALPTIVGSAPEILMAAIAARTSRIRVGSAGVMLPHYAALKVAEQFRVLDALAPGRIDLGVGRAPGGDMRTAFALNPNAAHSADDFPQQVLDLQAWTAGQRHQGIAAHPLPAAGAAPPEIWILGSSDYGARLAAHLGLPYAYAYFFMDGQGVEQALGLYRSLYRPSPRHPRPQATICVWALAADTEAEARHQALSRERWRIDRQRGLLGPLQPPDALATRGYAAEEAAAVEAMRARALVGDAGQVADAMRRLARELELDHLVVNTWAHDPAVRRRSYALLAQAFGLPAFRRPDAAAA